MGVTRRLRVFDDPSLQIWFIIAGLGAALIAVGILAMLIQFGVSILRRDQLRDLTGDPWGGRTLEWATSSPPPAYNFAFTPIVHDLDAWYDMKNRQAVRPTGGYRDIHMPKNTGAGLIIAAFSAICAFGLIWYMWWLAALGLLGVIAATIIHSFNYDRDFYIPAAEVTATEEAYGRQLAAAGAA